MQRVPHAAAEHHLDDAPEADDTVTSGPQDALRDLAETALDLADHFAMIPERLLFSGNFSAVVIYGALDRAAKTDGTCYVSSRTLARRAHASERTVKIATAWLVDQGYIEIVRKGGGRLSNEYRLPYKGRRRSVTRA